MLAAPDKKQTSRVVIVGAEFGGPPVAECFAGAPFEVTLIDRYNYWLITGLTGSRMLDAATKDGKGMPIRGAA